MHLILLRLLMLVGLCLGTVTPLATVSADKPATSATADLETLIPVWESVEPGFGVLFAGGACYAA
jgi:hypothetical protein